MLLETLPGVMRFVRGQMRGRRAKGLSVPQFRTLVQLRRRPAASLSSISDCLGSSLPTISRMISGLVRKGLVVRKTATQDRRQSSIQITRRGLAVIDAAWSGTQKALAERLADVPRERLVGLAKALEMLSRTFPTPEEAENAARGHSGLAGGSVPRANQSRRPASAR